MLELTFEQAFAELESVTGRLEKGDLSLDELLTLYARGQELARFCQNCLDQAELRITALSADDADVIDQSE